MSSLVTFGETMLRLSPPRGQRLSRMEELDVHVGGAESNVAVAASALDVDAAWLSALPNSDLGERIAHALRGEGVELLVDWTESGRVGTYYFERGGAPRGGSVRYDRSETPIRNSTQNDLPIDRVEEAAYFFTSGITPALSDQAATTTKELLQSATDATVSTAFDVNYRSNLWSPQAARETLRDLFPAVDVLFVAERDARTVFNRDGTPAEIARSIFERHEVETLVLTRSEEGALAIHDSPENMHEQAAFETDTVDPVGSGDAFVGGFLAKRLHGGSIDEALGYGAAMASIARTLEGDMALTSRGEVDAVLEEDARLSR